MKKGNKLQISYDYALVLIANEGSETLIGGTEKILNRAFKDEKNPNLDIKGLDVYYEGEQLGTLELDVRVTREADKIRELIDKLYANLTGKGTSSRKVEETLNDLDVMFKVDKSLAVRVLARVIGKWYEAATDLYMNARLGLGLKQADRAVLGEQFREDANALITEMFADLKKKNPPQSAEDSGIIRFSAADIGEFLAAYSRYLAAHKTFCIECKLCGEFFLSAAHNSLYCMDCKLVRKKGSKAAFREKSSDEKKIDEPEFCRAFCEKRELRCISGQFYSVDGAESTERIKAKISAALTSSGITSGLAKKTNSLYDALRLYCHAEPIKPREDEIHVLNGVIKVDGREGEPPTFIPEKRFCVNRLNIEYEAGIWQHQYYPGHFTDFLCGLLDFEDVQTLQEFLGYCLIPSTRAQAALFIIGNGGEGKSRIGVVLNEIFGSSMLSGDFQRVENDKFFRYNLQNKLLMNDDDMQMTALKSTGYIKNIITAEIPIDVEAKGVQSYQALLYSRFICFGNGSPKALYDKSDGFARRLLILSAKPKPRDRRDDPFLARKFIAEKEKIFCWALDGLRRLIRNDYRFTVSEKTRSNVEDAIAENCNVVEFMSEAVSLTPNAATSNTTLYKAYLDWCESNGLTALKRETFVRWARNNADKYRIRYSTHVFEFGKEVRGFEGIIPK